MFEFWDALEAGGGPIRNLHRTQGNNPDILRASRQFSSRIQDKGNLGRRLNELIILETVRMRGYAYVWHQHVPIALRVGVTRDEILALQDYRSCPTLSAGEKIALALADAVAGIGPIPATLTTSAGAYFDPGQIVAITMLAGFYMMITRVGEAVDLQTETQFVGWRLENLPEQAE
jgi:alkylhydroperoxidase family enzyme